MIEPLREELEILSVAGEGADFAAVSAGEASPVYFGSALTNFGVDVFLRRFLELAPAPAPRESQDGVVDPVHPRWPGPMSDAASSRP